MDRKPIEVLLVEGNAGIASLVQEMLKYGTGILGLSTFRLTHIERLDQALRRLSGAKFDIVLTDLSLPDSRGLETFRRLRGTAPELPLIVLSSDNDAELAIQAVREGAQDYLDKSRVDNYSLTRAIRRAIERKQAESERLRLLSVLEASLNEIYMFNADTLRFEYVNAGALHNLGYTPEAMRDMTPLDLKPEFTEAAFRDMVGPLLRREKPVHIFETLHRRADGSLYPVEVHLQLVEREGGRVFLAVINDITVRKQAEEAKQRLVDRWAIVYRAGHEIGASLDTEQVYSAVHRAVEQVMPCEDFLICLYDGTRNEIVGSYILENGQRVPVESYTADHGLGGHVVQTGQAVMLNTPGQIQTSGIEFEPYGSGPVTSSVLAVPMRLKGNTIGILSVQSYSKGAYTSDDRELLEMLASHAAVAIDNARLFGQARQEIAERKQAEAALRLQSAALESAANAIVITDCDGSITWANPAFTRLTGYALEDVVGKNPRFLKSGQQDEVFYRNLWDTVLAGRVWRGELVNRRQDGTLYTEEMTITPVLDVAGAIQNFAAIKQDVTQRKQAEEQIRYQADLLKNVSDAIVSTDAKFVIKSWNQAAEAMFGYAADEVIGRPEHEVLDYRYVGMTQPEVAARLIEAGEWKGEAIVTRKDGRPVHTLGSMSLVKDEAGNAIGTVAVRHDITARKQAEQALERRVFQLGILQATAAASADASSENALIERVTQIIGDTLYPDNFGVMLLNDAGDALVNHPSYRGVPAGSQDTFPVGQGITGQVAATGQPLRVPDVTREPSYIMIVPQMRSELCVPIRVGERVIGVVNAETKEADAFSEADERLLLTIAGQLATAIQKARLFAALQSSELRYRSLVEQLPAITYEVTLGEASRTTYISPQVESILGFTPDEWIADPELSNQRLHPDDRERVLAAVRDAYDRSASFSLDYRVLARDGRAVWIRNQCRFVQGRSGQPPYVQGILLDITEGKQAEEALRQSEERYRAIIEDQAELIVRYLPDGAITFVNDAFCRFFGRPREDWIQRTIAALARPEGLAQFEQYLASLRPGNPVGTHDDYIESSNGAGRWVQWTDRALFDSQGQAVAFQAVGRDVTERKQAEEALQQSEARYRAIVEDQIELIIRFRDDGTLTFVNDSFCRYFGRTREELVGRSFLEWALPSERERLVEYLSSFNVQHPTGTFEQRDVGPDGRNRWRQWTDRAIFDSQGRIVEIQGTGRDITERRQRERELEAVAAVSAALRTASARGDMLDIVLDRVVAALNAQSAAVALATLARDAILVEKARGDMSSAIGQMMRAGEGVGGRVFLSEQSYVTEDAQADPSYVGADRLVTTRAVACVPLIAQGQTIGVLWAGRASGGKSAFPPDDMRLLTAIADIAANAIRRSALHEETVRRAEQLAAINRLGRALSETLDPSHIYEQFHQAVGQLLPGISTMLISTYNPERQIISGAYGIQDGGRLNVAELPSLPLESPGRGPQSDSIRTRRPIIANDLADHLPKAQTTVAAGASGPVHRSALYVPMLVKGEVRGVVQVQSYTLNRFGESDAELLSFVASAAAIAIENARLFAETQQRLDRLQSLRAIDATITGSLDLRITLGAVLDQTISQLGVDAANVLLLQPLMQTLDCAAARGFRTRAIERSHVRVGEGVAGRVALERRPVYIADLDESGSAFGRTSLLAEEGFVAYYGVPIAAKGGVKGVLEVFHRTPLSAEHEWVEFLETLAGQAAIAIENGTLFDDLQRSNTELALAYDTTLEGWSRALDLRDQETEGHTRRVTETTMRLARAMGLHENELVHAHRGALLHDIGKMGIPDSILFKPGPLTDAEWAIMHKHPEYAYDLISPITFLHSALAIPYCHHEKWDGGGYPRGLKGVEIPLAARIFAVVDVWDALRSARPYRPAWPEEKVRAYIVEQSGQHFDPHVVEAFLRIAA